MPAKGQRCSDEHRQRISNSLLRYHEREREAARVRPADLVALARRRAHAPVRPALPPYLVAGADETEALIKQLVGPDPEELSPAKRMLCDDVGRLGALLRALVARYAETADPEVASRVATLSNARRQHLQTLGLDRVAREVESLVPDPAPGRRELDVGKRSEREAGDGQPVDNHGERREPTRAVETDHQVESSVVSGEE